MAALFLPAGSVGAAQILDVRVALHPGFTRVVFDTDVPTAYRVEPTRGADGEIRVHLEAAALLREAYLPAASAPSVLLEPEAGGTLARIPVSGPVLIEAQQLERPPRVVLDLRQPRASTAPAPATAEAVTPAPATAEAVTPAPTPPPAPSATPAVPTPTATPAPTASPPPVATLAPKGPDPAPAHSPAATPVSAGRRADATPDVSAPPARSTISNSQRRVVRPVLVPKVWVKFLGFAWISLLALALLRRLRQRRLKRPPELHPNVRRRLGLEDSDSRSPLPLDEQPERQAFRHDPIPEQPPERPTPLRAREDGPARLAAPPGEEDEFAMRDLIRMIQRLDDRLARVEAQLQAIDHDRGGLVQQTAAQAEELRSQRAALTRLQRALVRPRPPAPRVPTP